MDVSQLVGAKIKILFQDQHYVAVHKPAGLLVHRTSLDSQETVVLVQILRELLNQMIYPVHRLDRPTSGVILFALSSEAAQKMSVEFSNRKIEKKYLALVRGYFGEDQLLDYPLKEELDDIADFDSKKDREPQEAQTFFRCLKKVEIPEQVDRYPTSRYSLVEATPKTGRKHQIRRHLRHLNHPIIGDVSHGDGQQNRYFEKRFLFRRMYLCATSLSFQHPYTNQNITIATDVCDDFQSTLQTLGL